MGDVVLCPVSLITLGGNSTQQVEALNFLSSMRNYTICRDC